MLYRIKKATVMAVVLSFALSSCTIVPVKPWQKGTLAQDIVKFGGPNPMIKKFEEHIYTSKEGTKGGGGVSGGGCGCN
ncbi:MAG: DUF4266 domain-containing protein [Gammaproteobacteria bacterium]|nr:DUF4266 domain-containing protein [Gammaproteobacteria bacterium]